MSADPRGAESTADSRRWYLEVSGRRAGPFAWAVIVELARAGALHPDDRVWRMGLAAWSLAGNLPDLAPLIREPALSTRVLAAQTPVRRGIRTSAVLCALLLLATVIGAALYRRQPWVVAFDRSPPRPSSPSSPSGASLAGFTRQASVFEARYPLLAELRRVDAARLEQLDHTVRLGFRRGASATEINGYVAGVAGAIERERLAAVADSSALRFAVALRAAARTFRSSDPAQCVAILGPRSAAAPTRSAAALAAITPALTALLDAPTTRRAPTPTAQAPPSADPNGVDADARLECDRLLLMYDDATTQTPDTGAAFVRAMQGSGGS